MRFTTGRRDRVELNLTSLIDVVFILLMFFIVTTSFKRNAQLKIELPEAAAEYEQRAEKMLEVVIDSNGRYYIDGRALVNAQAATVVTALENAAGGRKDMPILISGDKRTPYQAIVTAMDSAAEVGLNHVSIATTHARYATKAK